jgi:hypothetical protein
MATTLQTISSSSRKRLKSLPSAERRLQLLRERHGDRGGKGKSPGAMSASFAALNKLGKEAKKRTETSGQSFSTAWDAMSPAGHNRVLRKLYTFFFFMLTLFFVWLGYRAFFPLPVWFDEGVAKALVFGVPVVFFASSSHFISKEMGLDQEQFFPGLFLGLAVGGLYGFAGVFLEVLAGREIVQAPYFLTSDFWWFAFLATLTAWWESLFFFGLPVQYVRSVAPWFSESFLGLVVVGLFLLFHAPLRLIVTGFTPQFLVSMGVLAMFAVGQYIFYMRTKNMYALVLSHALWGMVIEIYSR